MIVAKTKMVRIPETCKKCSMAEGEFINCESPGIYKRCTLTGILCPKEKKESGNIGYGMPTWCPLMDIDLLDED